MKINKISITLHVRDTLNFTMHHTHSITLDINICLFSDLHTKDRMPNSLTSRSMEYINIVLYS